MRLECYLSCCDGLWLMVHICRVLGDPWICTTPALVQDRVQRCEERCCAADPCVCTDNMPEDACQTLHE